MRVVALIMVFTLGAFAKYEVGITPDIDYIDVYDHGSKVRVERIQNIYNKLTDDFIKTSRPCPSFCLHPVLIDKEIQTVAEVEVVEFMKDYVNSKTGLIIDARLRSWYSKEYIPTAVNIPFVIKENLEAFEKIVLILGMERLPTGDFVDKGEAKELLFYCNGFWCDQSSQLIEAFIAIGYPKEKIRYYRGGLQAWKIFGLTTIISQDEIIKD